MSRRVVAVAGTLVVLLLAGFFAWRVFAPETRYEEALGTLPASTLRATYTDWAEVRDAADGDGLDAGSSEDDVNAFLSRAFDQDLVTTSALADSTNAMRERYGVSPLDAEWEAFGQDESGQVAVLKMADDVDLGGVEQKLRSLGYTEPAGGIGSGGTWTGGADLVASIDPGLTPVFQNAAVLADDHLLVLSDRTDAVSKAVEVARGNASDLDEPDLARVAGEPVTAVLWASDFACQALSMTSADQEDQRVADRLVSEAGGVSPVTGVVVAQQTDRSIKVGLEFETDDQASDNLQPRVDLAAGEAPGQGGSFTDRFTVEAGEADGDTVVLDLAPTDAEFVFSDLTSGPVLFATC
ncbi:hypothetical protein [Nocardioides iriomotensis]|uniref:DUF3352 domain-containing protein n=1 Tax=Nocardioides iriomotensis TaxID=715784 RepID=A0A4Q5IZT5_9ACTN|nr:hypothetical protein [Nocardioides iriomotensis]RYU10609.1 hypothetical protein ETU37_15195 [Nocardioides iriomotensis]